MAQETQLVLDRLQGGLINLKMCGDFLGLTFIVLNGKSYASVNGA